MSHTGFRILHTSDWHLGNSLHDRSRQEEYRAFLSWLKETIVTNEVDALLVSGDIFDTGSPSNAAQELYFSFLTQLNGTCCKNVVITAGNHDSPSTLNVARSVLELLHVRVIASPDVENHFANEVFALPNAENPQVILCAAPYLRDKALQASLENAKAATDEEFVRAGTKAHFEKLKNLARQLQENVGKSLPIIAMAHLYAAGSILSENAADTEYTVVGNLENVNVEIFPPAFDYVALGHIHRAQKVAGEDRIRYSGSPLPMGFDEANHESVVLLVDFEENNPPKIRPISVPQFRKMVTISGENLNEIRAKIAKANLETPKAFVRVRFTGTGSVGNLRDMLSSDFEKTTLEFVKAEYANRVDGSQTIAADDCDLSEHSPTEIFDRRLREEEKSTKKFDDKMRARLEGAFQEILKLVQEGGAQE